MALTRRPPPRLVVRRTVATSRWSRSCCRRSLRIAIYGTRYVRSTVWDRVAAGQCRLSPLEQRTSRDLQAQAATRAVNPTLKTAVDTYRTEMSSADVTINTDLLATTDRELSKLPDRSDSTAERGTRRAYVGAIRGLAGEMDGRDRYTAGYSECVSAVSVAIGRELWLPEDELDVLRLGARRYDIGKMGIGDAELVQPLPIIGSRWFAGEQAVKTAALGVTRRITVVGG